MGLCAARDCNWEPGAVIGKKAGLDKKPLIETKI
jgi:hypothetical protein